MKLRIQGNTIRIRVSRSETDTFALTGKVSELLTFGSGLALTYELEKSASAAQPEVSFADNHLKVTIPAELAQSWTETDRVGFEHTADNGEEGGLYLLVEKDFQCLHREHEDKADLYPHPEG